MSLPLRMTAACLALLIVGCASSGDGRAVRVRAAGAPATESVIAVNVGQRVQVYMNEASLVARAGGTIGPNATRAFNGRVEGELVGSTANWLHVRLDDGGDLLLARHSILAVELLESENAPAVKSAAEQGIEQAARSGTQ